MIGERPSRPVPDGNVIRNLNAVVLVALAFTFSHVVILAAVLALAAGVSCWFALHRYH